jgi:hypothetical protein
VLRGGYDHHARFSLAPHFGADFLDLLLGVDDRLRKDADVTFGHALVNQDSTIKVFLAEIMDTHGLQFFGG